MIIDLDKFIEQEKPHWKALEKMLDRVKFQKERLTLEEVKRLHYLYQRAGSDLAKLNTFAAEPELKQYLEALVGRAYFEIYDTRKEQRFNPVLWLRSTLPGAFRRHIVAFALSLAITFGGALFGGIALVTDAKSMDVLLPNVEYLRDPGKRVAMEENRGDYQGSGITGSAWYFQNNTRVAIKAMALGITWGIGTIVTLFFNGCLIGAVAANYLQTGHTVFLLGWLLPHGSVEIPAILIAGQAGLILAGALIGWGNRLSLRKRLREAAKDVVTLTIAIAGMMLWAGFIEAQFSQTHEPVIPYAFKIFVGVIQLAFLIWYFGFCGRKRVEEGADHAAE